MRDTSGPSSTATTHVTLSCTDFWPLQKSWKRTLHPLPGKALLQQDQAMLDTVVLPTTLHSLYHLANTYLTVASPSTPSWVPGVPAPLLQVRSTKSQLNSR